MTVGNRVQLQPRPQGHIGTERNRCALCEQTMLLATLFSGSMCGVGRVTCV